VLAPAHHGGAVEWQADLRGPVTGIATEFAYRFPHVIVYVDVETDAGVRNMAMVTRWTPTILRGLGWSRDSIEAGDRIEVTYQAHVTDPGVAHMRSIEVNGESLSLDP
jgi:hypothetical protein